MPTRNFTSGESGSVLVGATTMCVVEWAINLDATRLETSNTCDGAYGSFINGVTIVTGSVKAYFDTANDYFDSPMSLAPAQSVTLTLNVGASGKAWVVPARIDKISMVNNVKQVVSLDFDFSYNPAAGSLVFPT